MRKRLALAAVLLVALIAAAQLVRPAYANPPTVESRTIRAQLGPSSAVPAIVMRACGDCHSNNTAWPGYAKIAPLSWMMAYAVKKGRASLNFSEWASYSPEQQHQLLASSCADATSGKMPGGIWTSLHPETRLSSQDIAALCAASR